MRNPIQGTQFKRDVKLCMKRGKDMDKLRTLISILVDEKPIPPAYKDHPLKSNWNHYRDSHIEPDWLLIYKIDGNDLCLVRTGTHSDVFA